MIVIEEVIEEDEKFERIIVTCVESQ